MKPLKKTTTEPGNREDVKQQSDKQIKLIEDEWFGESPEGPVLLGSKCRYCGKVLFPQRKLLCPHCLKEGGLETVKLSRTGKLHTYAIQVLGAPGFEAPYAIGWIELPEGIKLFSLLTNCEPFDKILKIGMDMEMVVEKLRTVPDKNGEVEVVGYKFRPYGRKNNS